ncbi:MAG: FecR domain-containing protein, partial [Proteobacteria bacterium]|nr:FecR domain-containing protein [Pseudomonadota bacterium]
MHLGDGAAGQLFVPVSQHTLADAAYHRDGTALVLTDGAGARTQVDDFFAHDRLPQLVSADGSSVPGDFAAALAGQPSHVQLAQAVEPGAQLAQAAASRLQPIGRVDLVQGTVTATHVDGTKAVLAKGDPVFLRDTLESQPDGSVGLILDDNTTFALGEGGRMRLDELVYKPASKGGSLAVSILKGAFVFATGDIAASQSDAMSVRTPIGTIGIRGTQVGGNIASDGAGSTITLLEDPRGLPSAIEVTNASGTQYLTAPNQTVSITGFFTPPSPPYIAPPGLLGGTLGRLIQSLPQVPPQQASAAGAGAGPARAAEGQQGGAPGEGRGAGGNRGGGGKGAASDGGGSGGGGSGGAGKALAANSLDTSQAAAQVGGSSAHVVFFAFFTLGHDEFTHNNGYNHFDAFTVANSLQSGDICDGGSVGHNDLIALFRSPQDINSHLSIKNVQQIVFIIANGAVLTLDAVGIIAAPDGTTLKLTGDGTITIRHAHNLTIDATQFRGNTTIYLDADSGTTSVLGHALVVGGGITGSTTIDATQTVVGHILVGSPGSDTLSGGSGADTIVGLGDSLAGGDLLSGGPDNDVFVFYAGSELTSGTTIDGGTTSPYANGTPGINEIRFASTTPGDTLVLNAHLASADGTFLVTASPDTLSAAGQAALTDTTPLAIDASAAPLPLTIMGNAASAPGDTLIGGAYNDTIIAGAGGGNVLVGGGGTDSLDASQSTSNLFLIANGADHTAGETIKGGAGADVIRFTSTTAGDRLTLSSHISDPNATMTIAVSADPASVAGAGALTGTTPLGVDAHLVTLTGGLVMLANNGGNQIVGSNYNDTITGGTGADTIGALSAGANLTPVMTAGNDSIQTGLGNDVVFFDPTTLGVGDTVNGGGGNDELRLVNGGGLNMTAFNLSNIETLGLSAATGFVVTVDGSNASFQNILSDSSAGLPGANGNDVITLVNYAISGGTVDLGAGADAFSLANLANSINVANVETIVGGSANDTIVLLTAMTGGSVDLRGGTDTLTLFSTAANTVNVANVESLLGGTLTDTVVLTAAQGVATIDLGSGSDTLSLSGLGTNSLNVANVESILGGAAADTIVLLTAASGATIDLGGGSDTLTLLSTAANSVNIANVEALLAGTLNDTVVLTGPQAIATIDLGTGTDTLTLANGANSLNVVSVESILGGSGADTVVLLTAATGATIDLASGSDTLSLLGSAANTVNVANVESLLGGTLSDTVVLTAPQLGATIDLGTGADTLTLANGVNSVQVA